MKTWTKTLLIVALSLTAQAQKVTWQQINTPDSSFVIAIDSSGDLLTSTCQLRSGKTGLFSQLPLTNCTAMNEKNDVLSLSCEVYNYVTDTDKQLPAYGCTGINSTGTVVGYYGTWGKYQSFWFYHGQLPEKSYPNVALYGINDNGTFWGNRNSYYKAYSGFFVNASGPEVEIITHAIVAINTSGSMILTDGYSFLVQSGIPTYVVFPSLAGITNGTSIDKWGNVAGWLSNGASFVRWVKCTPTIGCQ